MVFLIFKNITTRTPLPLLQWKCGMHFIELHICLEYLLNINRRINMPKWNDLQSEIGSSLTNDVSVEAG